jgi:phage baseplate assembly protein V
MSAEKSGGLMRGVVVGIVTDVDDPDGMGRVRVRYPTLGDTIESPWVPVCTLLAGKDRGAWFMPEADDEVLVAFDNGHFGQPYVVGRLWNGKDKPPETETQNRVLKTPGGHQLRFEDKAGSKKVIVKTDGGLTITMDDTTKSIEIKGGGRAVTMQDGQLKIT